MPRGFRLGGEEGVARAQRPEMVGRRGATRAIQAPGSRRSPEAGDRSGPDPGDLGAARPTGRRRWRARMRATRPSIQVRLWTVHSDGGGLTDRGEVAQVAPAHVAHTSGTGSSGRSSLGAGELGAL